MARTNKVVLSDVKEMFDIASKARLGIEEIWLNNYRQYRGISEYLRKAQKENRSGIFVPKTFEKVETITPRLVRSLLSERPWVRVWPRMPQNNFARAALMQQLLDYQFGDRMPFQRILTNVVRNTQIYGIAPAQIGWRKKTRTRKGRELIITVDEFGNEVSRLSDSKTKQEIVVYNGPWVTDLDPFGFYWDPYATSLDDAEFVVVQTFRSPRWLKEQEKMGVFKNVNAALDTSMPKGLPSWMEERRQITGWSDTWKKDLYEVLEVWTPDRVETVVNRAVVVRNEETPFDHGELPFAVATDTRLPQEFAGLGLVLPISDLQDEVNAKRNQRLDNVNLTINKMWMVRRDTGLDEEELRSRSGGIIHVDDFDVLKEIQFSDVTSSAYLEEDRIDRDIQATTGVYDYSAGATPRRRETATGIVSLQSASDERFRLKVWELAADFLIPVYRQAAALNQQFLPPDEVIQILGPSGLPLTIPVSPDKIAGEFEFKFDGSTIDTVADRQFKLNQMIQLYGLINQVEGVNHVEYIRRILQLADVPDIDSIIPPAGQGTGVDNLLSMLLGVAEAAPDSAPALAPTPEVADLPVESMAGIGAGTRIGPTPFETGGIV